MSPKMYKFLILFLIAIISASFVFAPPVVQPIAQTEDLIKQQHENTRNWCKQQWESKEESLKNALEGEKRDLENRVKGVLWIDRVIGFVALFFASFLAFTLRSFLDKRSSRKSKEIDILEAEFKPPKPPKGSGEDVKGYET